jgi:hypothetical protein
MTLGRDTRADEQFCIANCDDALLQVSTCPELPATSDTTPAPLTHTLGHKRRSTNLVRALSLSA